MKDIEVFIDNAPFKNTVEIWVRLDNGRTNSNIHYNDGHLIETELEINNPASFELKPFLSLPRQMSGKIIEAITVEANRKGVNTKQDNILEGKLLSANAEIEFLKSQLEKFINKATR